MDRHWILPDRMPEHIEGIDLQIDQQVGLLQAARPFLMESPFGNLGQEGLRYRSNNHMFETPDAKMLYMMIRTFCPNRIIEIGSGFSSAVVLDTNERFFKNRIECTFIEPYPERLLGLLRADDQERVCLIPTRLQDVNFAIFSVLESNDILFVDSTHVCKTGSDVCRILFDLLPTLKPGVIIHFHDIFYPFEYPASWIFDENRAWNEIYLLRAFLQHNRNYEILLFPSCLSALRPEVVHGPPPIMTGDEIGQSLWIRKIK